MFVKIETDKLGPFSVWTVRVVDDHGEDAACLYFMQNGELHSDSWIRQADPFPGGEEACCPPADCPSEEGETEPINEDLVRFVGEIRYVMDQLGCDTETARMVVDPVYR